MSLSTVHIHVDVFGPSYVYKLGSVSKWLTENVGRQYFDWYQATPSSFEFKNYNDAMRFWLVWA